MIRCYEIFLNMSHWHWHCLLTLHWHWHWHWCRPFGPYFDYSSSFVYVIHWLSLFITISSLHHLPHLPRFHDQWSPLPLPFLIHIVSLFTIVLWCCDHLSYISSISISFLLILIHFISLWQFTHHSFIVMWCCAITIKKQKKKNDNID